ncbi:MAG: BCD family MFS transporter [Pseudomonadota bacterium]
MNSIGREISNAPGAGLSWLGIVRLGLVQTALGAIVVLTTSTLNRVMVVEYGLAAMVPGALVAWHYAVQSLRPRWGHGSDLGGRRTPWIVGGMALLALGGVLAAGATVLMGASALWGAVLGVLAFAMIGIGVGASGTSLLALLAAEVAPRRRAAAASTVWIMMIAGFVVTAATAGQFLDPFSPERLMAVCSAVAAIAFVVSVLAVIGVEGPRSALQEDAPPPKTDFSAALRDVWNETPARRFTVFVFVSMLAYSAQDLILEPFAGLVFGYTVGQSTQLAAVQHQGVLLGMIGFAVLGARLGADTAAGLRLWAMRGCVASAVALGSLALAAAIGPAWPLAASVFAVGVANGVFAAAAIGSMMGLAGGGETGSAAPASSERRSGMRMGLWGAAQAIAFGGGGFLGTVAVDAMRSLDASPAAAYGSVFAAEAALFIVAAWLALRVGQSAAGAGLQASSDQQRRLRPPLRGEVVS